MRTLRVNRIDYYTVEVVPRQLSVRIGNREVNLAIRRCTDIGLCRVSLAVSGDHMPGKRKVNGRQLTTRKDLELGDVITVRLKGPSDVLWPYPRANPSDAQLWPALLEVLNETVAEYEFV